MIYMDNAATTPPLPEVTAKVSEWLNEFGNASAYYKIGWKASDLIFEARKNIAELLGCKMNNIVFTSGATESNNQIIISTYERLKSKYNHIITTQIEHPSVLNTCKFLEKYHGVEVTYLPVDKYGLIDLKELEQSIKKDTMLVSIMAVNNEIGTIQDCSTISEICKSHNVLFHSDFTQALCHIPLDISTVDMFSASAHKFGGLKGVGMLYTKNPNALLPYLHGGEQERGLRAGTYNTLGILSLAEAMKIMYPKTEEHAEYITGLREYMKNRILKEIPGITLNGHPYIRTANNLNFSLGQMRGEDMMIALDMFDICVGTGSACSSKSGQTSHVLRSIGLTDFEADSSIRISLSHNNTKEEVDFVVDRMKQILHV